MACVVFIYQSIVYTWPYIVGITLNSGFLFSGEFPTVDGSLTNYLKVNSHTFISIQMFSREKNFAVVEKWILRRTISRKILAAFEMVGRGEVVGVVIDYLKRYVYYSW